MSSLLELASANLDREHRPILAPMKSPEGYRVPGRYSLSDPRDRCLVQAGIEVVRMHSDHLFAAVTQALTRLLVDVENGLLLIEQEETIRRMIDEAAKALLALPQLILCPLALGDVARHAQKPTAVLLKLANADLHGKGGAIFAPMTTLESDRFPSNDALLQALDGRIVETGVEIASMFADQFFPAVTQAIAGLAIDIENGRIIVKQKEGVSRVIHEGAEARLARAQLLLRLSQLRDVLQKAKLAQRPTRAVPGNIGLAVDHSQSAVRTHHPIFHLVAGTARAYRRLSGFGCSRPVLGVNQVQPADNRPHPQDPANLIRNSYLTGNQVTFPPTNMREALRLFQPGPVLG